MHVSTKVRAALGAVLGLAVLVTVCGCGASNSAAYDGTELVKPVALPAGSFTDTSGSTYDLQARAQGHVTLVYFGYTNCPDVCPTTMADLGSALRSLPAATQRDVQVVFVTSDPDRDTPAVMKSWLTNFDSGVANPFIGLRTDVSAVVTYAAKVGVPIEPPQTAPDGTITVTHGAQVLAVGPDGEANLVWLTGTTPKQYAHDIAKLVA